MARKRKTDRAGTSGDGEEKAASLFASDMGDLACTPPSLSDLVDLIHSSDSDFYNGMLSSILSRGVWRVSGIDLSRSSGAFPAAFLSELSSSCVKPEAVAVFAEKLERTMAEREVSDGGPRSARARACVGAARVSFLVENLLPVPPDLCRRLALDVASEAASPRHTRAWSLSRFLSVDSDDLADLSAVHGDRLEFLRPFLSHVSFSADARLAACEISSLGDHRILEMVPPPSGRSAGNMRSSMATSVATGSGDHWPSVPWLSRTALSKAGILGDAIMLLVRLGKWGQLSCLCGKDGLPVALRGSCFPEWLKSRGSGFGYFGTAPSHLSAIRSAISALRPLGEDPVLISRGSRADMLASCSETFSIALIKAFSSTLFPEAEPTRREWDEALRRCAARASAEKLFDRAERRLAARAIEFLARATGWNPGKRSQSRIAAFDPSILSMIEKLSLDGQPCPPEDGSSADMAPDPDAAASL